jgi:hypothetical protein
VLVVPYGFFVSLWAEQAGFCGVELDRLLADQPKCFDFLTSGGFAPGTWIDCKFSLFWHLKSQHAQAVPPMCSAIGAWSFAYCSFMLHQLLCAASWGARSFYHIMLPNTYNPGLHIQLLASVCVLALQPRSSGTHQRSILFPAGNARYSFVAAGNRLAARFTLIILYSLHGMQILTGATRR